MDQPGTSIKHHISIRGTDPTLGLNLEIDKDTPSLLFKTATAATPSVQLPK